MTTSTTPTPRRRSQRRITAFAVIFIAAACPPLLPAAPRGVPHHKHDLKQEVEDLEQQWRTAQLSGDAAAMDKLLADDYIGISLNGQVNTKAQQLARISTRRVILTHLDLSEMKVKLIGEIAIVTSRAEVEGTTDGVSVKGIYRYTRVYQHESSGDWKITSFEATRTPQPRVPTSQRSAVSKP